MSRAVRPSVTTLSRLFDKGFTRVPSTWDLRGPALTGLWWEPEEGLAVATPKLLRLRESLPNDAEGVAALLATEARYRKPWLELQAARLRELSAVERRSELMAAIDVLGGASSALTDLVNKAQLRATGEATLELELFGAPADQSIAGPALLRVLGATADLVEGGLGSPASALPECDIDDPRTGWQAGRVIQSPRPKGGGFPWLLPGTVNGSNEDQLATVLERPWLTLLAVLTFMAEAWAAEHQGGLILELPEEKVEQFAHPPQILVTVELADGVEVVCGTLGEGLSRVIEALSMAVVPAQSSRQLDQSLADIVAVLLRHQVWRYQSETRHYVIHPSFSSLCYRSRGHRVIYRSGRQLSDVLRAVFTSWARERALQAEVGV